MPDIKSVLVSCSSAPDEGSGILAYAQELSLGFKKQGLDVHFMSPTPRSRCWLEEYGILHLATDKLADQVQSARNALDYLNRQHIDLAVNNDNPVLQSIAPALACPLIVVGHLNSTVIAALACHQPQWTDHVVAISNDMLANYVSKRRLPVHKCSVVRNGIAEPPHVAQAAQATQTSNPGSGGHPLRAVYLGGFDRRKGGDLMLEALRLPGWQESFSLDWYGGLPDGATAKLGRIPGVRLCGRVPRDEILRRLSGYDVLLFPSRAEGCPMAMLEAMSQGVVPIASDGVGAMREMIDSGRHGYICPLKGWPEQMLQCVARLKADPARLEHMKHAVRQRFLSEFQVERVVERLLELGRLPTVDRTRRPEVIPVLRWHRISRAEAGGPNLVHRLCYRLGILRTAGELHVR
ncbi:MAG: glycosyltransferase family 4 protein [Proteobacteria bacterium]|nr:glycosyltransferase family 4 protein [Pseudomonadota bacterium]